MQQVRFFTSKFAKTSCTIYLLHILHYGTGDFSSISSNKNLHVAAASAMQTPMWPLHQQHKSSHVDRAAMLLRAKKRKKGYFASSPGEHAEQSFTSCVLLMTSVNG